MDKTDDASAASAWIDLIVEGSVNIHECENPKMRSFTNHRSFKAETMREWIINLARNTEDELKQELHAAKKISILIDGWTTALPSTHYVAIFAGYCCPKNDEYKEALLSFKPGTIDDHLLHFDNAIARYDLKVGENIFAIVGKR